VRFVVTQKKVIPAVAALVAFAALGGCTLKFNDRNKDPSYKSDYDTDPESPGIGLPGVTAGSGADRGCRFSALSHSCTKDGYSCHSKNFLGECGQISKRDLSGNDLHGKNLKGIELSDVQLKGVNLSQADLTGARMINCDLTGANLTEVNFPYGVASGTFAQAILKGGYFRETVVALAKSDSATGAKYDTQTVLPFWTDSEGGTSHFLTVSKAASVGMIFEEGSEDRQWATKSGAQLLSTEFTQEERALIYSDLDHLKHLSVNLDGSHPGFAVKKWYEKYFAHAGYTPMDYFEERIQVFKPDTNHLDDETVKDSFAIAANSTLVDWETEVAASHLNDPDHFTVPLLKGVMISYHPYLSMLLNRSGRGFVFGHEARHSDCDSKIQNLSAAVTELKKGGPDFKSNWEKAKTEMIHCGYPHSNCSDTHSSEALRGQPACDDAPWGAYTVGGILSAAFAQGCTDCTERDRIVADAEAKDSFGRLELKKGSVTEMLDGSLGEPDMTTTQSLINK